MADRKSLAFIGAAFSGITFAVMLIGFVVVKGHLEGRLMLDGMSQPLAAASLAVQAR